MEPQALQQFLRSYNIVPKHALGQNFLTSEFILTDIADSVTVKKGEAVLEIGPGIGNLTKLLLEKNEFVLSIERDERFKPILRELSKKHKNFRFEFADILQFNFQQAMKNFSNYHVVANIPYYITGKIIQIFLKADHKPRSLTLLVQKEVAQNLTAKPGQLNLLALSVQLYGQAQLLLPVPKENFYPVPKVDSALIQITLPETPPVKIPDEKKFFSLLRACFTGKRKQLHNTLVNNAKLSKDVVSSVLKQIKIDPSARPQQLSLKDWLNLYNAIEKTKGQV